MNGFPDLVIRIQEMLRYLGREEDLCDKTEEELIDLIMVLEEEINDINS